MSSTRTARVLAACFTVAAALNGCGEAADPEPSAELVSACQSLQRGSWSSLEAITLTSDTTPTERDLEALGARMTETYWPESISGHTVFFNAMGALADAWSGCADQVEFHPEVGSEAYVEVGEKILDVHREHYPDDLSGCCSSLTWASPEGRPTPKP